MTDADIDVELLVVGLAVGLLLAAAGTRWIEQTVDDALDPFGGLLGLATTASRSTSR